MIISIQGGGSKKDATGINAEFYNIDYATLIFDAYPMNSISLRRIGKAYQKMIFLETNYTDYKRVVNRLEINNKNIFL